VHNVSQWPNLRHTCFLWTAAAHFSLCASKKIRPAGAPARLRVGAQWVWGTEVPQRGPGAGPRWSVGEALRSWIYTDCLQLSNAFQRRSALCCRVRPP